MKKSVIVALLLFSVVSICAQTHRVVESVPVSKVRLLESDFKHAEQMDKCYLMALDADRLLAPFRKEAGLEPKAENYPNWENTGLDGHIGGHYLSALAYMYASTGDNEIRTRLEYFLSELELCQRTSGDGYLSGVPNGREAWKEISEGNIRADRFGLNNRWVPLYNIHKIYAGLRDAYLQAGYKSAKTMLVALADWMYRTVQGLDEAQMQRMLYSEHGGLNEVFADVAVISGDKRFVELAKKFSDKELLEPLLKGEDRLTGMHANTQIPKVIGYKRIADIESNDKWDAAARLFWDVVVKHRTISIGGNSVREHFHPANDFSSMLTSEQGPETCNTYNMMRLTKMLYETSGKAEYIDYYERAMFNHILSTQHPEQGGFVYFTPMRAGHYRVYSQPQTSFWCCVGSGLENHARYGEMIYAQSEDALTINLFVPSEVEWKHGRVVQQTKFPEEEATSITIYPAKSGKEFTLRLRVPSWSEGVKFTINDESYTPKIEDGYAVISRKWLKGDLVRMTLPMSLRVEQLPDSTPNYSFLYGPIVLASAMGTERQDGLFADSQRMAHAAFGPQLSLEDMPCIVGEKATLLEHFKKERRPLTFSLSGVYPAKYEGMILKPFYKIHASRYMVYWSLRSEYELQQYRDELARRERARAELNAITADVVVCGEQQPESDHFVEMVNTVSGNDQNRHWRAARESFSYQMSTSMGRARVVRVTYLTERGKQAVVEADGVEIGRLAAGERFAEKVAELPLPEALQSKQTLRIKIRNVDGNISPRVYELRMIMK